MKFLAKHKHWILAQLFILVTVLGLIATVSYAQNCAPGEDPCQYCGECPDSCPAGHTCEYGSDHVCTVYECCGERTDCGGTCIASCRWCSEDNPSKHAGTTCPGNCKGTKCGQCKSCGCTCVPNQHNWNPWDNPDDFETIDFWQIWCQESDPNWGPCGGVDNYYINRQIQQSYECDICLAQGVQAVNGEPFIVPRLHTCSVN